MSRRPTIDPAAGSAPARRWLVLAVAFLARAGVGVQFIAVAALLPDLRDAYAMSYTASGLLLGLYMTAGIFLALPGGLIASRIGDGHTLQLGLMALIAGGLVAALADGYSGAMAGRLLGGLGAVFVTVTGAKLLTDWFAGAEIATAMSLLGVTWPVGIALGLAALPVLAGWLDWRSALLTTTVLPLAALLFSLVLPQRGGTRAARAPYHEAAAARGRAITGHELAMVVAGGVAWALMSSGGYVVFSGYAPAWLAEQGVGQASAGLAVSLLSWLFIVTIPLGGLMADRWQRGDALFWTGCLAGAGCIAMVPVGGPVLAWVALAAVIGLTVGPVMALPAQVLDPIARTTGLGVFYTLYYLGTVALPAVAGWLKDATGSLAAVIWFAAVCLALAPFALLVVRIIARRNAGAA